jgi:hypothetical protein
MAGSNRPVGLRFHRRRRSLMSTLSLIAALVVAGTALAATYPPHLSRYSGQPGVVVTLGPNSADEPPGVPLAANCPNPAARFVPRLTHGVPGDMTSGNPLPGTFGQAADGWLTFRFRVPSVSAGVYDVVIFCGALPATSTGAADAAGFTVTSGAPATDATTPGREDRRDAEGLLALALMAGAGIAALAFALQRTRPRTGSS